MKDKPEDVNEHQWSALVGIWCEEKHMVSLNIYHLYCVPIPVILKLQIQFTIFAAIMCKELSVRK